MRRRVLLICALAGAVRVAAAGCDVDARVAPVAEKWLAHQPQAPIDGLSPAAAVCFRTQLLDRLGPSLGPVVGYKVGVYTAAARSTYGASGPAVGVLLKKMLVDEGTTISAAAGVAFVSEADFVLVVKDAGINKARTRKEAYKHLRGWRPFVELPDLNYVPTPKPDLGQLIALNVNARAGVLGKEVRLAQTPEGFAGLAGLTADVKAGPPDALQSARGVARETLGDPLEIVLAARDGLRAEGKKLRAGDLISIGTITPPRPVKAGETLEISYSVAPSTAGIRVVFGP